MNRLFILIICLFTISATFSQQKRKGNGMEYINSIQLTGGLGTSTYYGDLCENMECMIFRPQASLGVIYRNSDRLLLRSEFAYVRLAGSDARGENRSRNLSFRSNNYEISFSAVYDFIPYERKFRYRAPFTPYAHGGVGATIFSPQANLNGKWVNLRPLQTEGIKYAKVTPIISYGLGMRYKANPKLNISLELGYRWTFTDYLDDVSTVYTDNSSLSGDEAKSLADRTNEIDDELGYEIKSIEYNGNWIEGHQRGNPKRKDGYFLFGFKAEYLLKYTVQNGGIIKRAKFR